MQTIKLNCENVSGLKKPLCEDMSEVVTKIECTDIEIGGVIYRVWSAFQNKVDAAERLENLMLNSLESDEIEARKEG